VNNGTISGVLQPVDHCISSDPIPCFKQPITIQQHERKIHTVALLDSGASACFMDSKFIEENKIPTRPRRLPIIVEVIDGRPLSSGAVTQETEPLQICINDHLFSVVFNVIHAPSDPVILGNSWLSVHNPQIDWRQQTLTISSGQDNASAIPAEYQDFAKAFAKREANMLPPHRPYDCSIELLDGKTPPFGPLYKLSPSETKALREQVDLDLGRGFIRRSTSSAASPVLFVSKKDGSLRMCIDYRKLNDITIKNRYPLPHMLGLLERLNGAKIFSKIDLRNAYHLLRIKEGDEWKTAFRTPWGLFEYLVMPFGLTNAPSVFQALVNDTLRDFLDRFVVVYLDDILIFSTSLEEHISHVKKVLGRLQEAKLYAKAEKCEFHCDNIEFLGHIVTKDGLQVDPNRITAVTKWPAPTSLKELQSFLGFGNFCRRFIQNYSRLVQPLTDLLKKGRKFMWTPEAESAFNLLKTKFTNAPILLHADPQKQFFIEADASDFAIGAALLQKDENGFLHPISYHSRKFLPPEINYEIYDKELLAIVESFKVWRHFLEGATHQVIVHSDHRNLEYFFSSRNLNRRQARWSEFLSRFNFMVKHQAGSKQQISDCLSRNPSYMPQIGSPEASMQQKIILGPNRLASTQVSRFALPTDSNLIKLIKSALPGDAVALKYFNNPGHPAFKRFQHHDSLIYQDSLLYIPKGPAQTYVMHSCHDVPLAGHFGVRKTQDLVKRKYWWPKMIDSIKSYVSTCDVCNRAKSNCHKPYGLLQPLPVPDRPWSSTSLDFITDLPLVDDFDSVLVVVDRFSKMAHFIPCAKTITGAQTAKLFLDQVVRLHGLPDNIVSDRGPQFVSKFWARILQILKIERSLSSAYHPQTDGQTERVNQVLEQYLRCFVDDQQKEWVQLLPQAEFAYNNTVHVSTGTSPFFANYGLHPRFQLQHTPDIINPAAEFTIQQLQQVHLKVQQCIKQAQERFKRHADKKRSPGPNFQVGDLVWLSAQNTKSTCAKLASKRTGPYRIISQVNPVTFRLQLPKHCNRHPTFHVSLLEPYQVSTIPGRQTATSSTIPSEHADDEDTLYELEKLVDSRMHQGRLQYLVHWKGYDDSECTWEPYKSVKPFYLLLTDFHQAYPNKPKPHHWDSAAKTGGTVRILEHLVCKTS
jgi:hypothetical protein